MTQFDYAALAEDRSRFFWWLSVWFLDPPDAECLASLQGDDDTPPADDLDTAWSAVAAAKPAGDAARVEALGIEFTRLFSGLQEGMGPAPPFESVWREKRLIGETTVAVIETYAQAGFADIAPEAGPQDHIGVELRFLALLALREAEAWRTDDAHAAGERRATQRAFIEQHLGAWVPYWADAVARQTTEPLFAALARLLAVGLTATRRELDELTARHE
jgi:TorA maturation chaperone TorD